MKKLIVIALVVVLALSMVAVLAACGEEQTVTGEVSYVYYSTYGVKVDVTVKGNRITAVKLYSEEETGWVRTSPDNADLEWTGHDATEAAYDQWIKDTFVGQTVDTVLGWEASLGESGTSPVVGEGVPHIAGGTQSSARIILAVQDALSKLA